MNLNWVFSCCLNPGALPWTSQALAYKASLEILKYDALLMWRLCTDLQLIEYWPHFNRQRGDDWLGIYQLHWSGCINASFVQGRKWHWPLMRNFGTVRGWITQSFKSLWVEVNGNEMTSAGGEKWSKNILLSATEMLSLMVKIWKYCYRSAQKRGKWDKWWWMWSLV